MPPVRISKRKVRNKEPEAGYPLAQKPSKPNRSLSLFTSQFLRNISCHPDRQRIPGGKPDEERFYRLLEREGNVLLRHLKETSRRPGLPADR